MREAMLGSAVAALALGWVYGRLTERTRRAFRDVTATRGTYEKAMKVRSEQVKSSMMWWLLAVGLVFAVCTAIVRWDSQ
ncbi:MAG: hypothetical protein ACM30G_00785 [Micromonosporaceae bacterium]